MDNLLTPKQQKDIVEDALHSYPPVQMPNDMTESVMARIQTQPLTRFRVATSDYLLSIVMALVLGAILFGFQSLPPYALAKIQIQGILLWQSFLVNYRWLLPFTSVLLGASLAGIVFYQLLRLEHRRI